MKLIATLLALSSLALAAPAFAQSPAEPVTVIHAGTLIAVPGQAPRRNASVIVHGRRSWRCATASPTCRARAWWTFAPAR